MAASAVKRKSDIVKMPKLATLLTDIQVKNAEKKAKDYRLTDGGGMLPIASITRKVISVHASVASSIAMC
ncbi:hypothetical protein [Undibacterium sp.]|uniref:hypothetical protein n=1 Tax=Undibacterium sp. TaxID=1914977 RepID=UPI00272D4322|nr:hypothetical protein [Undibacterium sp.]